MKQMRTDVSSTSVVEYFSEDDDDEEDDDEDDNIDGKYNERLIHSRVSSRAGESYTFPKDIAFS